MDGGIVSDILVTDGDVVEQGDLLIRLDRTLLETNQKIYSNRLREGIARKSRLSSERDGLDEILWDDELLEVLEVVQRTSIMEGNRRLFSARKNGRFAQAAQLQEQIEQFENQIKGIEALQASKTRQSDMLTRELQNLSGLKKKGLVTNPQLLALEREREELVGQIGEHTAELARIANSINEAEIEMLQIDRQFRETVLTELREVDQEIDEVAQQLQATNEQLKRIEVKSPVSGIVHELNVFTIGGVIGPGADIVQIIPQDQQYVIEANVEPQFIDELYVGQPASIRFSAFNQRTTPELNGNVKGISANVVFDEQTGFSFYKVLLEVGASELARLKGLQLVPGMPVEGFIKTKERTALNFLVKPLQDQINRAFREE